MRWRLPKRHAVLRKHACGALAGRHPARGNLDSARPARVNAALVAPASCSFCSTVAHLGIQLPLKDGLPCIQQAGERGPVGRPRRRLVARLDGLLQRIVGEVVLRCVGA